jgi:hypothetical protein
VVGARRGTKKTENYHRDRPPLSEIPRLLHSQVVTSRVRISPLKGRAAGEVSEIAISDDHAYGVSTFALGDHLDLGGVEETLERESANQ